MTDVPETPPVETPPVETPPAAASRPEGIPDDLWGETGFNADAFGKYRAPPADLPAAADGYTLPAIEGVEIEADDPLIKILRARSFEQGIGQAGFEAVLTDYAAELRAADEKATADAKGVIGDNADGRITAVSTWLDGKLPKEQADALKLAVGDGHAMLGLEKLMNAGVNQAPPVPPPPPVTEKSYDEIRKLMQSPAYSGKPSERNAAVMKEVTDWFAAQEAKKAKAPPAATA